MAGPGPSRLIVSIWKPLHWWAEEERYLFKLCNKSCQFIVILKCTRLYYAGHLGRSVGCTLLRIWYYGRRKAKLRSSPKALYHCLLMNMHLLYMFQPYLGKEIHYFTRRLGRKWTSQKNPIKIKKLNSIFDINFFSRKFNKVCKQSFFLEVLCLNW